MKIFKKTLAMLLSIIMVFGIMPASVFTASAEDACPINGATGTGTEEDPVIVDTFIELRLALYSSSNLFIQVDNVIECTETIGVYSSKTLIVNGTLYGQETVLYVDLGNKTSTFTLQGNGTIHSVNGNALRTLGCRKDAMKICGNLTFISGNDSAVYSDDYVTVNGGVFRTYNQEKLSLISSRGVFSGGSFPNGISLSDKIELADGCMLQYSDGTVSTILQKSVPVDVVNINYTFGFASQTPAMPEDETEIFLGDYIVGTEEAKITFSFTTCSLPDALKNAGFSTTEEMTVISAKNGVVKTQNSGAAYTIDNTVADTYTVIQTITYSEGEDKYEESVTHIFTVSVHSVGYTPDIDCPIEGAMGSGTEADPIIVDTFAELKAALKYDGELYIQVDGYIECFEMIEPAAEKTLTVNGTLHRDYGIFEVWNDNFVLQGNGKIISERGTCLENVSSNTKIKGNLEIHSEGIGAKSTIGTSGEEKLIISGGTISNVYQDSLSIGLSANVILKEGKFLNGITTAREWEEPTLFAGSFYRYEDGDLSRTFRYGVPVEVVNVLDFATQSPAMPEDESRFDLGLRPLGKYGVLTVGFTSKELSTELADKGYYIEEKLTVTNPNGKVIKTQNSGNSYSVVPEIEGVYIITETLTLKDKDGNVLTTLTNTFTFTAETMYTISARISGVPEGKPVTINLYKAGEDTLFKTTTAYGQGDFDINNLPLDVAFTLTGVPNGDYVAEIVMDNYVPYRRNITVNGNDVVDLFVLESYKTVVVDITGMYKTDVATVKIYEKGTDTVVHTATIRGNSSHIFASVEKGDYTVEVSANGYKTKTSNLYIYNSDTVKDISFEMELDPSRIDFGFATQSPEPTAAEIIDGHTDLGLVNTLPTFSFTAKQLYFKYMDMGYSIKTQTQVKYSSGGIKTLDSTTWTCGNYDFGTNEVTQIVMLLDPDGKEIGRKTHTYTFTYAKLFFNTRTPSVSNEQAEAGVSELGTLTTAPKFAFTAVSLSGDLRDEGYSQKVKMEAYQDGELVYSADNGNTYIHIYPGEGKVVQTITLIDPDGNEVGSLAHTYNFTVEFPEGTIALDADFLTLAENSTHQLSATFAPESLAETLVWTSSNHAVARVDGNGKITAVRPGSVLITATLGNGATAYCTVLVTGENIKAYVGGIGLKEGEYLAQGANAPTTVKPADNYAYLATVNGKLTLTLHNYSYSGMGTFTSKNAAYGIYSTQELKVVAEGTNKIGPMSAPVDRYTSYGIGKGDSVSISSDANSVLNITGVSTAISSSRYVFVSGNLNITDVTSGISCTHAQAMGGLNFESGNVNINCTGTAISVTGNYVTFSGADVTINCKAGINLVRQGEITIDSGSLKMYASASGINVKSGQTMTVNGGTAYIEAVNNAVALEGALNVNGGSIVLISTDTASDSSYSAISGAGTLTLASGISSVASTGTTYSTSSVYSDSRRSTFDYVSFRDGSNYAFVKQPVGGDAKANETLTITWETGFKPIKLELITFDGTSSTVTTLDSYSNYADFGVLPEGGYYQLRAYYATNYSITSDKFYVYSTAHTVTFDSGVASLEVAYGALAVKPSDPEKDNKFFYGWLTPDGKVFDFSTPITEDITLTAGWADIKVNGVAMPNGTYLGLYSGAVTTARPSDKWAYYKDGVLTLYNFNSPYGAGIEFGEIDLTIVSSGNGNAVSCIISDYGYANLTIDGTATLNVGHEQWTDYAILVYNTITFKCDTIVEGIDYTVIGDAEGIIVDGADVKVYAYSDMYFSNTIYGCEAPITVTNGSLYLYCEGRDINTDSYITNPDKVLVYASDRTDISLTDDNIVKKGSEPYELDVYRQIMITSYNTVNFYVDGYAVLMQKVATGMCIEKPLDSDYGNRVFLGWYTEDGSLYDFNTPVTQELSIYAKFAVVEPVHGDFDFTNNIISGILPGTTNLDYYGTFTNPDYAWSYQTENGYLGTGTVANVVNGDELVESFSILLYGDVNGDGWCDGMDAVLVSCIVNGMLDESDIGKVAYMAADCNHDGVIDEADVDLLNQAGALLANVDQSKPAEELLETSSAYVEYIELIDQTFEIELEDETEAPEVDVEPENTTPEQNAKIDILEMIIAFIKSIFKMLISYIPVSLK